MTVLFARGTSYFLTRLLHFYDRLIAAEIKAKKTTKSLVAQILQADK